MKKIIFILGLILFVYYIYNTLIDRRIKYLYIGNNTYNKYNEIIKENYKPKVYNTYIRDDDYRVIDLMNEIKDNKEIGNRKIQNLLVKSNVIVLSVGMHDLNYKTDLDYKYVDELLDDIEELLKLVRKYNKDKIYLLGFYNKNEYYSYTNRRLINICKSNKITYINIEEALYKQLY